MPNEPSQKRRKRLGAYYTPPDLSLALSDWCIRSSDERVLEPGFGGCDFLEAAQQRLRTLGARNPMRQLFGCDVDANAFIVLKEKFGSEHLNGRYLKKDFLSITPADYGIRLFDVVLGNPPYVSHHLMSNAQIASGQATNQSGISLSKRASLWAYFVTHGVSFLRTGGRAAWVLPISFLYADYAGAVRQYLSRWFERVIALRISERIFTDHDVSEQSIILLCDGRRAAASSEAPIEVASVRDVQELRQALEQLRSDRWQASLLEQTYPNTALTSECRDIVRHLEKLLVIDSLGSLVDVRIGLVTGANSFFILTPSAAKARGLPARALVPIVTGAEDLRGLSVKATDLEKACRGDARCLLLDTSHGSMSLQTAKYLRTFPIKERKRNATFAKREPWHKVNDHRIPDIFFSYMSHRGPKIALNTAGTTCVNSVHRAFKKETTTAQDLRLLAISVSSTFSQLSAELCGRAYGDGVLKLELNEMRKMQVIRPANASSAEVWPLYRQIDRLHRSSNFEQARDLADDYLLRTLEPTARTAYLRVLRDGLTALRNARTSQRAQAMKPHE